MKKLLLFLLISAGLNAQLHHYSFGSQGNSVLHKKYLISQSIGQKSLSGNSKGINNLIVQGFQQHKKNSENIFVKSEITTKIYPNPFTNFFEILIDSPPKLLKIEIFTSNGVLVSQDELKKVNGAFKYMPPPIAVGQYIIKLKGKEYKFSCQLIKK